MTEGRTSFASDDIARELQRLGDENARLFAENVIFRGRLERLEKERAQLIETIATLRAEAQHRFQWPRKENP